jgi:phage protein D
LTESHLDQRFNDLEKRLDQRFAAVEQQISGFEKHMSERRSSDQQALSLQAREYERRLVALNHAHEKAIEVQHTYVTQDKYEDKLAAEQDARQHALARIDEKFDDYMTRADARVREVENALAAAQTASEVQSRAAEDAARKAKEAAEAAGRKSNRNIAIVGVALTIIIAVANFWGSQEAQEPGPTPPPVTTTTAP